MKHYLSKLKAEIVIRLLFYTIYITAIAALPYLIKNMIDCDYANGIRDVVSRTAVFVLVIAVGMLSQYITQRTAHKITKKFYSSIRSDLFHAIISKSPDAFHRESIGAYSSKLQNDVSSCEEYIEYMLEICEAAIGLITYAVYIFMLNADIAAIIYITAIITLFLPKVTGKTLSQKKKQVLHQTGEYNTKVLDLFSGYSLINAVTRRHILRRHNQSLEELENKRYAYGKYKTFANVFNGSVMYLVHAAAFAIIAFLLFKKSITAGIAAATIAYIQDFMFPLRTVIDSVSLLKSVSGVKDAVISTIHHAPENPVLPSVPFEELVLDSVGFRYDTFSLPNISYTFKRGKKYAIIGASGNGKSTLLKLMAGSLTPTDGFVRINGQEASYSFCSSILFYMDQQSHIFAEPFLDNITVFRSFEENDNLIAPILEKRKELKSCMDCSTLSGGEMQIISIIRALLSKKDLLLLDEPFSALDEETEYAVCHQLLSMPEKTIIIVTHNEHPDFLSLFDGVLRL